MDMHWIYPCKYVFMQILILFALYETENGITKSIE